MTNHEKRVVVYCRESRDDGTRFSRIETQRDMLIDFCEQQRLGRIVEIVLDDNKTGTDFARLEPLKEKARRKAFDIFLCKDAYVKLRINLIFYLIAVKSSIFQTKSICMSGKT